MNELLPYSFVAEALYTIWLLHANIPKPGKAVIFLWNTEKDPEKLQRLRADNMPKCFSTNAENVPQIIFDKKKTAIVIAVGQNDIKYIKEVHA